MIVAAIGSSFRCDGKLLWNGQGGCVGLSDGTFVDRIGLL